MVQFLDKEAKHVVSGKLSLTTTVMCLSNIELTNISFIKTSVENNLIFYCYLVAKN